MERFSKIIQICLILLFALLMPRTLLAAPQGSYERSLEKTLRSELTKVYPGSEIEFQGGVRWLSSPPVERAKGITLLGDDSRGNLRFSVHGAKQGDYAEGSVNFSAWSVARVAIKRIRPGDLLDSSLFSEQKINVAIGSAREYRGVILPVSAPIQQLEATQTVMENQFLTSNAVRRIPDVRRGDALQLQIESGGLVITTSGIAQEPSYISRVIRVQTLKGRRELTGQLLPGGVVEVKI